LDKQAADFLPFEIRGASPRGIRWYASLHGETWRWIPRLAAQGYGAIINLSSVTALIPAAFEPTYLASKAYVLAFSESLAAQLEPHAARVQAVLSGMT
jgi:short-subunit dehydrogenase